MSDNEVVLNTDNDNISLSVIIPFYNTGRYLVQCLDSVLKAEITNAVEIILVDDGSTDDSAEIAKGYAARYSNIRIITTSHEGQSEARNAGIKEAKGKYIFFCDSDDEVIPYAFSRIIRLSRTAESDIVLWDAELFNDDGSPVSKKRADYFIHKGLNENDGILTGKRIIEKQLDARRDFPATVWLGMHLRTFLTGNDLYFEKGLLNEDELWVIKTILKAQKVEYINVKAYRYRIRPGSITNPESDDRTEYIKALLFIYPALYSFCEENFGGDPFLKKIEACLTKRYLHMIFQYDFCKYGYGGQIDRKKLKDTAGRLTDKCRVMLLNIRCGNKKNFSGTGDHE